MYDSLIEMLHEKLRETIVREKRQREVDMYVGDKSGLTSSTASTASITCSAISAAVRPVSIGASCECRRPSGSVSS